MRLACAGPLGSADPKPTPAVRADSGEPQVGQRIAVAERVTGIDAVLEDAGDPGLARDGHRDGSVRSDPRFRGDPGLEGRTDDGGVRETLADGDPPLGV